MGLAPPVEAAVEINEVVSGTLIVLSERGPTFGLPLVLTVVHGFSCKEAAAILQIPLGTCLSRLYRGRKRLEHALWDYAVATGLVTTAFEEEP